MSCPGAVIAKSKFLGVMILRLFENTLPMMSGAVSIFVIIYGLFCYYCWLRTEDEDIRVRNATVIFTAMAGIAIALGSIKSHPQWYLYLAPYLAISAVLYAGITERFMLFETLGSLALLGYNFACFYWVYVPKSAKGMLLDILAGGRESLYTNTNVLSNIASNAHDAGTMKYLRRFLETVCSSAGGAYITCMIIILVLLCKKTNLNADRQLSMRPFALSRLIVNAMACYLPLLAFAYTSL